jgi:Flp pilus assembly protein TadD
MRSSILVVLCFAFSFAAVAWSQDQGTSQSGNQASQSNQSQTSTNGNQNMSGKVSHDRKSVTNDKNDKRYTVDNPQALQGMEDQHVALIVHVDPDNNVIHVVQVEPPQQ